MSDIHTIWKIGSKRLEKHFWPGYCVHVVPPSAAIALIKYRTQTGPNNYSDVIMSAIASQITSLAIVYWGLEQRKHQSSASLAFVRGTHRWPVNSPHIGPVTRKMFPFGDAIMWIIYRLIYVLPWIIIFWSRVGWFANNFHEWRRHAPNNLTNDHRLVIYGKPHIISLLTCFYWRLNMTQRNRRKLPSVEPRHCCWRWVSHLWHCDVTQTPILTSFWPIVFRSFLCWSHLFSRRRKIDNHTLTIGWHALRVHWLACKKCSFVLLKRFHSTKRHLKVA